MTFWEIQKTIEGKKSRIKTDMQISAMVAYRQANLISSLVAKTFGGKHKTPTPSEAFPGIFSEEVSNPKQQDWRIMKARMEQYAMDKRAWEVKKRGNEDRGTASTDHSQDAGIAEGNGQGQGSDEVNTTGDAGRN